MQQAMWISEVFGHFFDALNDFWGVVFGFVMSKLGP
jgi:hypothetical protein